MSRLRFRRRQSGAFILAAPRSGTTWLQKALNAHPDVYCTEHRMFGPYMDLIQDEGAASPRLRITLDQFVKSSLQPAVLDDLPISPQEFERQLTRTLAKAVVEHSHRVSGKAVHVDKVTPYAGTATHVVDSIRAVWPKSKVILLLRDGRDVLTSGVHHWKDKTMAGNARTHASDDTSNTARFFTDAQVTDWALHWSDVEQASRRISADRLLIVKYEDMLEDQGRELTRILRHLGVTASPAAMERCINESSFESMSGGRQRGEEDKTAHIRKGVAGDWRNHFTVADARLFDEITGDLLVRLGYESDRSWANASV